MGSAQVPRPFLPIVFNLRQCIIAQELDLDVKCVVKMFLSVESMLRCNGTMEERTSLRRASIGGLTTGSSQLIAPTLPSLEMQATGGLDAQRLVDSPALCPSTRVSLGGASSLPRMRKKTLMAMLGMKTSTWRVVTLK